MCVCAYPRVEFPSRLTRRPYLLSKRRHFRVERTTKEPASRVLRTHTHIHTGWLCIFVTLLIQWRHLDRHLYCFLSMVMPFSYLIWTYSVTQNERLKIIVLKLHFIQNYIRGKYIYRGLLVYRIRIRIRVAHTDRIRIRNTDFYGMM